MENLGVISERFETAKTDFAKLKKKFKSKEPMAIMSFDDFLESK